MTSKELTSPLSSREKLDFLVVWAHDAHGARVEFSSIHPDKRIANAIPHKPGTWLVLFYSN